MPRPGSSRCRWLLLCCFALMPARALAAAIVDPGFGPFLFAGGPSELSGLTRVAGDDYYAVSDAGVLVALAVGVDPATGAVTSVAAGDEIALADGADTEGLAYDPGSGAVWVSDELGPSIRAYDPASGDLLDALAVPPIFASARANRSLESLARDPLSGALWTANEEALVPDGPLASFGAGTLVRLQRFDASGAPAGQWAYRTDPIPGGPVGGQQTNGVSDLLALPSGELLVLERSLSSLAFGARIYQLDFAGASITSDLASLATEPFVPVTRTLLWETSRRISNFEGLALGPRLDAGDFSLLLIADDGGGVGQALYPLRVQFVPEPASSLLVAAGLLVVASTTRR